MRKTGNLITSRVKKTFLVLVSIFVLFCVGFALYSYQLIEGLTQSHGMKINNNITAAKREVVIKLESDGVFYEKDLRFLFPFLNNAPKFQEWIKGEVEEGSLIHLDYLGMQGYYELHKTYKFKLKKVNDCDRSFCFQRRLHFEEIPSVLWRGLIGVEDNRFLDHKGVDPMGILRALYTAFKSGEIKQGGSTLTQQLVKNLFLTQERTFSRKIKEMIVSLYIENMFSKEEILESYFNEVVWGSLGGVRIKGVYAASLFYFSKPPRELNAFESSILSALLKGPYYYHPLTNTKRLRSRAELVYSLLKKKKFVSKFDDSEWKESDWKKWKTELEVFNLSPRLKAFTYASTTLDFFEQYIASIVSFETLKKLQERIGEKDIAIKFLFKDIKACEKPESCMDMSYYSKRERDAWKALSLEKHQVGSLLKPFVYQFVFDAGKTAEDRIETSPLKISLPSGVWAPRDHEFDEPMISLGESLQKSRNITFVRMAREHGFLEIEKKLLEYFNDLKKPLSAYPAQLLGSYEASLSEMMSSYEKFFKLNCDKEMGEQNSLFVLSNPNMTTISRFVGDYLRGQTFFGKTGTSNNSLDNWFIGMNEGKAILVWTGLEGSRVAEKLNVSGASTSFKVYEQFKLRSGHRMSNSVCGL